MDKQIKIFGIRPSLIGDVIISTTLLKYYKDLYPNSYICFGVAKKCASCLPLLYNHKNIDRLYIHELLEKPNPKEQEFFDSFDIKIPVNLEHKQQDWMNYRSIYDENYEMLGIDWQKISFEDRTTKLDIWWDQNPTRKKTIAFWPLAGNAKGFNRSPSKQWSEKLVELLNDNGFGVFQFGHQNDYFLNSIDRNRLNELSFFDQIKKSLECEIVINTDSGSGLCVGAYEHNQISLLTRWEPLHTKNNLALSPRNKNNISLFAENGCDNIDQNLVLEAIKLF